MATTNSVCPAPMKATSNGSWQGDNPLDYALPLIIVQICLVVAFTRTLAFLLRPLRQPRVIAEIIHRSTINIIGNRPIYVHLACREPNIMVAHEMALIRHGNCDHEEYVRYVSKDDDDGDDELRVHVSVMNRLGEGKRLSLHCRSKDDDLGQQTVTDGGEFGWDFSVNAWGTTLFYCDMGYGYYLNMSFDAFSYGRDWRRCHSCCLWLVSAEGVYGLNGGTGLWEFMYFWPI
ncbi:hypothetical protein H6P81_004544 [Aristolochia fimbriata]|uniref:S-protein homolog n=1 Tax=Aristolochia fimbriata TaxID=158543 RepID=A0AAV7FHZ6_ARIFI|nr:hypothetical protein H6P81_004544 [Aristolochia fimbriata]